MNEIKGYCIQKDEPNPNKPVDIETNVIGKNLLEHHTFEVNGITYTDTIPEGMNIGITKQQYCEYVQLKEIQERALAYNEHLIRDAKYHLNLGHLKKMKKILLGEDKNEER